MRLLRILRMRLHSLFHRTEADAGVRREIELHLEMLTREQMAAGLPAPQARAAALRQIGNITLLAEQSRDTRGVRYLHDFADDVAFAIRLLRKSPVFTVVAVLSLGLGIGANTAIFTLIKRMYLDMLPVREPERVFRISWSMLGTLGNGSFTYPLYREMANADTPFSGIICGSGARVALSRDGQETEPVSAQLVSGNYYQVLGVQPYIGRLLTPDDDRTPGGHPVVVLSYNYWRKRFASDSGIAGQTVRINTTPMTVIGVSPPGFDGLSQGRSPDVVIPVMMQVEVNLNVPAFEARGDWWLEVVGRLKPGATAAQAEASVQSLMNGYFAERSSVPGVTEYVRNLYKSNRAHIRPMATGWHRNPAAANNSMVLLGITGLVLLAACVNLANLLLARAAARRAEMSVRLALGAGRWRLVRQLLTESVLLAALGGLAGLLLAVISGPLVVRLAAGDDPQVTQSGMPDLTGLLFCFGGATVCGLLFGMAPAWQSAREELAESLGSARTVVGTRLLARKVLLSVQIGLTLLLLAGATLFVRTMRNMQTADLGFVPEHLLQLTLLSKNAGYSDDRILPYMDRVVESIRAVPGVRGVTTSAMTVMANSSWSSGIQVEGVTLPEGDRGPNRSAVGPDYFSTMQIPLVLGREFNDRDSAKAPYVAIVNEAFAKHYYRGENPIGRKIDEGGRRGPLRYTIVGVATDGKYRGVRDPSTRFWYVPLAQSTMRQFLTVYVRTAIDPESATTGVRRAVVNIDPNVAATNFRTVESQIAAMQRFERMIAVLAAFLGALAVILAAIGLYGILSYSVSQRQREIGIRMALGASPVEVVRLVVGSIAGWAALGVLVALPAVYYGSVFVKDILYGVEPADPAALLWAGSILAATASVAAWLPANRAARVEPSSALRME
ncbi:MAG: ABC transporter permease [Acidobacteria bacterium]|nr:ABC transporter permease [Acidobacteriota bacterium]